MLYDMSNGAPMPIPSWAEEIMRNDFPDFFNGKPIKIKVLPQYMRRVRLIASNDRNGAVRMKFEPPKPTTRKARGSVYDPELEDYIHVQYSAAPPTSVRNGLPVFSYKASRVDVMDGFTIQPHQKDLLFYIHFLCPNITGNKCGMKVSNPFYDYDRPEIAAADKISEAKKARELENLVYFDIPYDIVLKAVEGLAMKKLGSEEQNRVALHDAIKNGSETFRRNAFEIIGSYAKKETKKEEAPKENLESVHELINHLVEQKSIKNDSGKWYIRDRRGDGDKYLKTSFFESDSPEGVFALIDHLKVNKELLDKLRKL
jgi:hypothetical protein